MHLLLDVWHILGIGLVNLRPHVIAVLLSNGDAMRDIRHHYLQEDLEERQNAGQEDKVHPTRQIAKVFVESAQGKNDETYIGEHRRPRDGHDHVEPIAYVLCTSRKRSPNQLKELEAINAQLDQEQDESHGGSQGEHQREESEVAQEDHELQVVAKGSINLQGSPIFRFLHGILAEVRHPCNAPGLVYGNDLRSRPEPIRKVRLHERLDQFQRVFGKLNAKHHGHLRRHLLLAHSAVHLLWWHQVLRALSVGDDTTLPVRFQEGDIEVEVEAIPQLVGNDLCDQAIDVLRACAQVLTLIQLPSKKVPQFAADRHLQVLEQSRALLRPLVEGPVVFDPGAAQLPGVDRPLVLQAGQPTKNAK
mmetsp:Transcript_87610/g.220432  ORF Transcript_87610/g.220432 Transcript_87610/m.220432 type:complete len:361 (+) Transcript_87610:276-1358(+)